MEDEPDDRRRRRRRYGLGAIAIAVLLAVVAAGGRMGWSLYSYNTPAERMPPDLCALLRAETLQRLVPEQAATKPVTNPHSGNENSGHCTVGTKSPRTTESRALLSLYLYRFAGRLEDPRTEAHGLFQHDVADHKTPVHGLGDEARVSLSTAQEHYCLVDLTVRNGADVLIVRYDAAPADCGPASAAAAAAAREVLARL